MKGIVVTKVSAFRARLLSGSLVALSATAAMADMRPSLDLRGDTGLIEMPTGDQQPDGFLSLDYSQVGPILRYSVGFQISPRLSGTFRYVGYKNWNALFCPPDCAGLNAYDTYYDRNFDISYQLMREGRWLPAITIGLQDFVGTGLDAGEYIAATKTFAGRLKATVGVGFGRLGSYNSFGQPFGPRKKIDIGLGGNINYKQWFRGNAAVFGGLEYQIDDAWTAKVEYSSDADKTEVSRGLITHSSPLNFGVEYHGRPGVTVGAYYLYGSQIGFNVAFHLNPGERPAGGIVSGAPMPINPRPAEESNSAVWATDWADSQTAASTLIDRLNADLNDKGITILSLSATADTVQVRYRNDGYDAEAQAAGRVARAMTYAIPASVEVFELVPVDHGMPAAKITLHRGDLEAFDLQLGASAALLADSPISDPGRLPEGAALNPAGQSKLTWGIAPGGNLRTFDPGRPFEVNFGVRGSFDYEPRPGFILSGALDTTIFSDMKDTVDPAPSPLQHVRSDLAKYDTVGAPRIDSLTAAWYGRLAPNLYGRITAGYLERMFGGVSTEVLYRPQGRRWALGFEANYVAQRDTDGGFGFSQYDYKVATGHLSGYLDMGKGYHLQLDVGRYLAGDVGGTVTLTREFANGWKVGAFATKTNVSAQQFGEGSFDKGLIFVIPLNWFTGHPTRTERSVVLRPIERDGGARLNVDGRLYDVLEDTDSAHIAAQWGRIWK